jgi:hypothetical protein
MARNSGGSRTTLSVTELLGGVAGAVVLLYGLGGLLLGARLRALGLPIEATLATLPTSTLVVEALRALVPGAIAAAVVYLFAHAQRGRVWRMAWTVAIVVIVLAALVLVEWPLASATAHELWLAAGTGAIAAVAVLVVTAIRGLRAGTFALFVIALGFLIELTVEWVPPTRLDFVTVRLKESGVTDGFYLASDGDTLYLAPSVLDRTTGIVTTIPRSDVAAYAVRKAPDATAVGPLRGPEVAPLKATKRQDARAAFVDVWSYLADIRTDPGWVYPPLVPYDAARYLLDHRGAYAPSRSHPQVPDGERVALNDLLAEPQLYLGEPIVTTGVVRRATAAPSTRIRRTLVRRTIVVAPKTRANTEASCEVTQKPTVKLPGGTRVELRGVTVAIGQFNERAGAARDVVTLVCSYVKPLARTGDQARRTG